MLVYIVLFIFLMILAGEYELGFFKNEAFLMFIILLLGLFAGFRGAGTSRDYESYQIIFDNIYEIRSDDFGHFLPVLEPGFTGIVLIFRSLFIHNYILTIMLFYGLVTVSLKILSIKKISANPYLVILFYYSQYYFLHEMTQIRIGLASAILFIAVIFYLRGEKWVFTLFTIVAVFFHYSAILYLLILFFNSRHFNKIVYSGIIGISIVFGILQIPLLNYLGIFIPTNIPGRLANYAVMVESGLAENINVFNVLNLLNIGVCLYFIIFISKETLLSNKPLVLFLKCNIISIFFLSFLSGVPSIAFRVSELFGLMSIFVYASLVNYLPFRKLNILIVILIAGIVFYSTVFHAGLIKPYYIARFEAAY